MTYAGKFGKALALALAVWCAGTGCMLVTYAKTASKPAASGDPHACCKARHKTRKRSPQPVKAATLPEGRSIGLRENLPRQFAMKCCPLTSRAIVSAARDHSNDTISVTQTGFSSLNLIYNHASPLAVPLRLSNRAHSYLLGCAFLI